MLKRPRARLLEVFCMIQTGTYVSKSWWSLPRVEKAFGDREKAGGSEGSE